MNQVVRGGITGYPTQSFMPKQSRQEKEKGINQKIPLYLWAFTFWL